MGKVRRNVITIVLIAAGVTLAAGIVAYPQLKSLWEQPLGPSLGLPTLTPTDTGLIAAEPTLATPAAVGQASNEGGQTPTVAPTPARAPLCGGPEEMTILAIGADSRSDDYQYGLADVLRIVHVDFVTPRVSVLSIPRDLWVEIPEISHNYGITHGKLNQAYFYGTPGMGYYDGPGGGAGLLARTLDLNFGLRVDRYVTVNMRTFEDIVDAVGGIDIYLEAPVDGTIVDKPEDNMGYFAAGWHHLNGDAALRFSRIRKVDNVFARMDRQSQVVCALKDKALSPASLTSIPQLIAAFNGRVLTDLSPAEISQLACLAPQVVGDNLVFAKIPQDMLEPGSVYSETQQDTTFIWDADFDQIRQILVEWKTGTWPSEPQEAASCPLYPEK